MVRIHSIGAAGLYLYALDHNPPHVHLRGPDYAVTIDIETGELMRGDGPAAVVKEALAWVAHHRRRLLEEWKNSHG